MQTHGSCTTCCKCATHFHATCASRAGYSMEVRYHWWFILWMHFPPSVINYNLCISPLSRSSQLTYTFSFYYINLVQTFSCCLIVCTYVLIVRNNLWTCWWFWLYCILDFQLHCLEKNGKQVTTKLIYCAVHRLGLYIIYDIYCYWSSQWELIFFFLVTFSCSSYFLIYMLLTFYLNAGPQIQMLL